MKVDKMIWLGIVMSTFIYAGIVYTMFPNPEGAFEDGVKKQITLILYGVALATFVAALVVPNAIHARSAARLKMVVALALFESCAIYGLLAAFLARDWRLFVPTWIVGLIGMWRVYPSDSSEPATV
jgi:hypothetical protein